MNSPNEICKVSLQKHMEGILPAIGEDPTREGLLRTPARFAKALEYLTQGYRMNLRDIVGQGIFKAECNDIVIVRDIEFYSLCEHHVLPFYGKAHVAYIPSKKILGLSKIPRIVDFFARRLQVQERMTSQIANAMAETIQPSGVGVVIEAFHLCMMMRGVEKQNGKTITSAMLGDFMKDPTARGELFQLLMHSKGPGHC